MNKATFQEQLDAQMEAFFAKDGKVTSLPVEPQAEIKAKQATRARAAREYEAGLIAERHVVHNHFHGDVVVNGMGEPC